MSTSVSIALSLCCISIWNMSTRLIIVLSLYQYLTIHCIQH